jgi:hypothetical protein
LLDAEFGKNLEPEGEIGKRGKTGEKGGDYKVPPLLGENERRQAERQEDEHEGGTGGHHLHPVAFGIGVIQQKHGKEDEEETLSGDGQQHARPQSPVARPRDISFLQ